MFLANNRRVLILFVGLVSFNLVQGAVNCVDYAKSETASCDACLIDKTLGQGAGCATNCPNTGSKVMCSQEMCCCKGENCNDMNDGYINTQACLEPDLENSPACTEGPKTSTKAPMTKKPSQAPPPTTPRKKREKPEPPSPNGYRDAGGTTPPTNKGAGHSTSFGLMVFTGTMAAVARLYAFSRYELVGC